MSSVLRSEEGDGEGVVEDTGQVCEGNYGA